MIRATISGQSIKRALRDVSRFHKKKSFRKEQGPIEESLEAVQESRPGRGARPGETGRKGNRPYSFPGETQGPPYEANIKPQILLRSIYQGRGAKGTCRPLEIPEG